MLDIEVSGCGTLKGSVKAPDLKLTVSGQSDVDLTGEARYLKLDVSAADIDLSKLGAMSGEVTATQRGEATVRVSERLVATTNLGGTVFYKGRPDILRVQERLLGSSINNIGE